MDFNRQNIFEATSFKKNVVWNAGLRSYMLKVYNYMATGVLLTGIISLLSFKMSVVTDSAGMITLIGLSLSWILLVYTGVSVARVFFITSATFGAMSIYGYTTKRDLTKLGSFLMMGLIGIIIASLVNIFLKSAMMYFVVSILGVLIFVGLTAYDTQKIKNMYSASDTIEISGKKAIMGALTLYLDFINLFIMLLRLFGQRR